ncbi:MAG: hypothetical protein GY906_14595 [bacterium]|nr:hypothetical protein [bacterium]
MRSNSARIPWFKPGRLTLLLLALIGSVLMAGAQAPCGSLPPPTGTTIDVYPAQAGDLRDIVAAAAADTTILLHDGLYDMSGGDFDYRLAFDTPNVTLRSASGNRDAVILDGDYGTNELVSIYTSDITIADITLREAYDHPIHMSGSPGNPISGILIYNVRIVDPGQQAIKVNPSGDGWVDNGTIECCDIELTNAGRPEIRDSCYTGGIDVHQAQGWIVRNNRISGFWCNDGLSEHGIHFWKSCRDTVVEENVIVDCARGIGFGLGSSGSDRIYPDDPYPGVGYMGHIDGIIRNNFVAAADSGLFASPDGFDTGIGLEQAHGARVVHNTVASTANPLSSSIEWRFPNTAAEVMNNLVSAWLLPRDGAQAVLAGNIESAPGIWFTDISAGDLHLTGDASATDLGVLLEPGLADTDIDRQLRDSLPDVGADEESDFVFWDDFESGDISAWGSSS